MQVIATQGIDSGPSSQLSAEAITRYRELGIATPMAPALNGERGSDERAAGERVGPEARSASGNALDAASVEQTVRQSARKIALASLADIGVFFAVLMVGFAYVWRRGDLDWVRSVRSQVGQPGATEGGKNGKGKP